jgi:hypothetical protein
LPLVVGRKLFKPSFEKFIQVIYMGRLSQQCSHMGSKISSFRFVISSDPASCASIISCSAYLHGMILILETNNHTKLLTKYVCVCVYIYMSSEKHISQFLGFSLLLYSEPEIGGLLNNL